MNDYISREAALDSICTACEVVPIDEKENCPYKFTGCAFGSVLAIPAADVVEVRHGRWINGRCSECGEHAPFWAMATTYHLSKYCHGCGATMEGGQDDV